jgi:6,7-dimethyl-8-ribityllumazine synthase
MGDSRKIEGGCTGAGKKIAIVAARFNSLVVEPLVQGALDTLRRNGVRNEDVTLVWVPGCFELPVTVKRVATKGKYDAVIALGAVIRGATPHFDYVAGQCAAGLQQAALSLDMPVTFGVLTCDTTEQAFERAGVKFGNKGTDAALTALEMANLFSQLD